MTEPTYSTIKKRNENLLQNQKKRLKAMTNILSNHLFPEYLVVPSNVLEMNHHLIKDIRERLVISEETEKIALLISKKGKLFGRNVNREGYISKRDICVFHQEEDNKSCAIPSEFRIETRGSNEDLLSWESQKLHSMNHRIRFLRNAREGNNGDAIAFYFQDMEECKKVFNFMRAINILEIKGKKDTKDTNNFCDILKRLNRKFASQVALKFRKCLGARSNDLRKIEAQKEAELRRRLQLTQDPLEFAASEILNCNKNKMKPSNEVLKSYADEILEKVSFNNIGDPINLPTSTTEESKTDNEEFFESGFILNYHLHCVEQVKSENEMKNVLKDANKLIQKYGKKLKPHPIYNQSKMVVSQEMKQKNDEITNKIQTDPNLKEKSLFVNVLKQATKEAGTEIILTDKQTLNEIDCLQLLATGEFSQQLVKVTHEGLDERSYQKMAKDMNYANQVYKELRQAFINSKMYEINNQNEAKVVAIECNPKVTGIIYAPTCIPNKKSKHVKVPGFSISQEPAIRYLSLCEDSFDTKGDMEWPQYHMEYEKRGGLDYYFPRGWKGCGLKVLDKYGADNIWLTDFAKGWAVAYHGVGSDPASKIKSILSTELRGGPRQLYDSDEDINELIKPTKRKVGSGIYFAKKIEIPEKGYSQEYEVDGKKYKAILQCRLEPLEIRIPRGQPDYYIVPKGANARPYRILIKEVSKN